jgi:hypothetical protein
MQIKDIEELAEYLVKNGECYIVETAIDKDRNVFTYYFTDYDEARVFAELERAHLVESEEESHETTFGHVVRPKGMSDEDWEYAINNESLLNVMKTIRVWSKEWFSIQDRETGTWIDCVHGKTAAEKIVKSFEEEDRKNDCFEENFYEIIDFRGKIVEI